MQCHGVCNCLGLADFTPIPTAWPELLCEYRQFGVDRASVIFAPHSTL
jgi:hypothetical protein